MTGYVLNTVELFRGAKRPWLACVAISSVIGITMRRGHERMMHREAMADARVLINPGFTIPRERIYAAH